MSDVSGIPYMGPMGQGNFFAPQFSYNPQINPTAGYAGPIAYGQNVTNNLYSSGGGFGTQTAYYAGLGASYGRQIASSDENPYRYGGVPASLADPGASLSGGYTTGAANMPSFDTGSNFGFTSGGMGALDLSRVGNPYSGGLGSGGGYSGPSIDWGGVGNLAAGMGGGRQDPYPGMSMPGGLGSPMGGSSGASPFNWSDLWGGGGGHTSGIAPDTTGGRAPSVDWNNIQSPPTNYGTFQGGGDGGYSSGIAPDTTGGRDFEWPAADPAPGMAMPGGLGSPMTMPEASAKAQDQPAFDFSGGMAAGGNAPAPMPSSEKLLGYDPKQGPVETDWSTFQSPSTNYDTFQGGATGGGGPTDVSSSDKSAQQIADEARGRLADIIGSPETVEAAEAPAAGAIPLPRERPEGADAARPPADVSPQELSYLKGKGPGDLKGVNARAAKAAQEFAKEYNASQSDYSMALRSGLRPGDKGAHGHGKAMDFNLIDRRNGERLNDYQTRDPTVFKAYQDHANQLHTFLEKNYPDLAATHRWGGYFGGGPGTYGAQDIMHHDFGTGRGMAGGSWKGGLSQASADAYGLPTGGGYNTPWPQFNFDWSNAPIKDPPPISPTYKSPEQNSKTLYQLSPDGTRIPVPIDPKGMFETTEYDPFRGVQLGGVRERSGLNEGQELSRPPADIPSGTPFVNDGTPFGPPAPAGYAAPAAAPVKHSGLELARANIDTPIEKIALERGGQKAVDQINFMAIGKTPRELLASYGGMFMDKAEPLFQSLGITRQDFDKAITMPQTRQDLKMRFGEGLFGSTDELPTAGSFSPYPDFNQSTNIDDRRGYSDLRSALGALTNNALQAFDPRDMIERNTPIPAAGSDLSTQLGVPELDARLQGDPAVKQWYKQIDDYDRLTQDTGSDTPTGPSMRDFRSPATDYSAFQQPASSRADLAKTMTFGGGFSPSPEPRQGGVGPPVELTPEHMRTMEEIESHQNPKLHDKGSSYKGLYQLDDTEFRKYGGTGSIFNAEQNTKAATAKMYAEGQRAQDILGRALTPVEQYMVHQQGLAGTLSHLANPDQPAWKSFQQASQWSDARAKTAIWGNLSNDQKAQFGNDVNSITSRDFINLWTTMYYQKMVASGLPPGGFSDRPQ